MMSKITRGAVAAAFGLVLLGAASGSKATIVNISATDALGTAVSLVAGQEYRLSFIGTVDGGAYDSANVDCATGACAGWTNSIALRDPFFAAAFLPGGSTTVDIIAAGALGSTFATALGSLTAYQTTATNHYSIDINSGVVGAPISTGPLPIQPFTFSPEDGGVFHIVVFDADGNRLNNFGGVSLDITAVPEPTTWGMMLLGLGGIGAAMRSRRKPSEATAA